MGSVGKTSSLIDVVSIASCIEGTCYTQRHIVHNHFNLQPLLTMCNHGQLVSSFYHKAKPRNICNKTLKNS